MAALLMQDNVPGQFCEKNALLFTILSKNGNGSFVVVHFFWLLILEPSRLTTKPKWAMALAPRTHFDSLKRKFCERLSDNFAHYWRLGQCSDLDERTCGFRGKHKCRCLNPAKPHEYHFKMFCWNCSETGYCLAFYWYCGKEEVRPAKVPATLWPVMKLVDKDAVGDRSVVNAHITNFLLLSGDVLTSVGVGLGHRVALAMSPMSVTSSFIKKALPADMAEHNAAVKRQLSASANQLETLQRE